MSEPSESGYKVCPACQQYLHDVVLAFVCAEGLAVRVLWLYASASVLRPSVCVCVCVCAREKEREGGGGGGVV